MKTNGNDYANPVGADVLEKHSQGYFKNAGEPKPFGLTKREQFAAMALQGLLANPDNLDYTRDETASLAIGAADALINALNKEVSGE